MMRIDHLRKPRIHTFGKQWVPLDERAERGHRGRRYILYAQHGMGVTHRYRVYRNPRSVNLELIRAMELLNAHRDILRGQAGCTHVDPDPAVGLAIPPDPAGQRPD